MDYVIEGTKTPSGVRYVPMTDEVKECFKRIIEKRKNPKTLQYIMGHSDIGVTLNTDTHVGYEDAQKEMKRIFEA